MAFNKGLGRGLSEMLSASGASAQRDAATVAAALGKGGEPSPQALFGRTIIYIAIGDIVPNPRQPRKYFDDSSLTELSASIKAHGVIQPLIVRKKENHYELVAGERRWRAAKMAQLNSVPALVKSFADDVSLEQAIVENVQREDLHALEEAESYLLLMKEFGLTQEQVAEKVGKARSSVANSLRLNELALEVKESLRENEITAGHARAILAAGAATEQIKVWKQILLNKLNVREAESLTGKKNKEKKVKDEQTKKSVELMDMERKLTEKFATKIDLSGTEQKGSIAIKYFSRDDLERIYALLLTNEVI
ncbi:chromosome partitioning protein ParB [Candidatus Termititenax persephonae]|uniref:Chromosome partitioning protein ParB n=1 Tax=Candidatus Termititenax persephonae TaxID=2218525 RepID=A0A388TIS8_9BACT|nr:chromosome partitioning protein ParB [Candidatus Termititenax persephonae]